MDEATRVGRLAPSLRSLPTAMLAVGLLIASCGGGTGTPGSSTTETVQTPTSLPATSSPAAQVVSSAPSTTTTTAPPTTTTVAPTTTMSAADLQGLEWERWSQDFIGPLTEFVEADLKRAAAIESAALSGDYDAVANECLDATVDIFIFERGIPSAPDQRVNRSIDDWLRSLSIGYSFCMNGNYELAANMFSSAEFDFDRLTRFLDDVLPS